MSKRILGILLALAMLMSAFPAYAEDNTEDVLNSTIEESQTEEAQEQPEEAVPDIQPDQTVEPSATDPDEPDRIEPDGSNGDVESVVESKQEPDEGQKDPEEVQEKPDEEESLQTEEEALLAEDYRAWSQYDSRWADLPLGSSSSQVKKGGCLVTSVTKIVVQAGLKSASEFNVADMVKLLNSNGGFTSSGDLYWGAPASVVSGLKYNGNLWGDSYNNYSTTPDKLQEKIIGWINSGYHMILGVNGCGHWVVVDEALTLQTGKVYIMDSGSSSASWNVNVLLSSRYTNINCVAAYSGGKAGGIAAEPLETELQNIDLAFSGENVTVKWGWGLFEQAPAYNDTLNLTSLYLSEGAETNENTLKTRITGLGFEKLTSNGKFASATAAQPAILLGCKTYTGSEGKRTVICAVVHGAATQPESAAISGTAANNIYTAAANYISKYKTEDTVLWLSGFGTGGAAAARLAVLLAEKGTLSEDRISVYTFGSPNCAEPSQVSGTAIFNSVSRLDLAAWLPLGAKRLGTAKIYTPSSVAADPHSIAEYLRLLTCGMVAENQAEGEQILDRVVIQGPVDLQVLDEAGNLLTACSGGIVSGSAHGLQLSANGQDVTLLRSSNTTYQLKLFGTGSGSLELCAQRFCAATGEIEREEKFAGISCENGKYYSLKLADELRDLKLYAEDGSGEVIAQVLTDGTECDWPDTAQVHLDHELILLRQGDSFCLPVDCEPQRYLQRLQWTVTNAEASASNIVEVSPDGTVLALSEGTAWVTASVIVAGKVCSASCRVDVVSDEEESVAQAVERVALGSTAATVNLFSTSYAQITVLLETAQNRSLLMALRPETELPQENDSGAAISAARFKDEKLAELFSLRVVDDRTLEIVPNYCTLETAQQDAKAIAASYSSAILVSVDGTEYVTQTETGAEQKLTIAVKKTTPTIRAAAVKFNSYLPGQSAVPVFTGGKVLSVQIDQQTAARNTKLDASSWLDIGSDALSLCLKDGVSGKQSGKMYLLCTVEGWAVLCPAAVPVSAAETAPKLSLSPGSAKLLSGSCDTAVLSFKITPAEYADAELRFLSVTEGSGSSMRTYANGEVLNCEIRTDEIRLSAPKATADGKDHSYRLNLAVCKQGKEKVFSVNVTVLRAVAAHALSVGQSGTIDTSVPNSPIRLTMAVSNYHLGSGEKLWVEMLTYVNGTYQPADDLFNVSLSGNVVVVTEKLPGSLNSAAAYYAKISVDFDLDGKADTSRNVKLKIISSQPERVQPSASIRASGSLDLIRPGSRVTIIPSFRNLYGYELSPADLKFYRLENKQYLLITEAENPFAVEMDGTKYVIRITDPSRIVLGTSYSVRLEADLGRNGTILKSGKQPQGFSVKMGAVKVTPSRTGVELYRSDRFSSAEIMLSPQTGATAVARAALDNTAAKYYELVELGDGRFRIQFRENMVTAGAKSLTAKVSVWLEGNTTARANTTVAVKINLKTIK